MGQEPQKRAGFPTEVKGRGGSFRCTEEFSLPRSPRGQRVATPAEVGRLLRSERWGVLPSTGFATRQAAKA